MIWVLNKKNCKYYCLRNESRKLNSIVRTSFFLFLIDSGKVLYEMLVLCLSVFLPWLWSKELWSTSFYSTDDDILHSHVAVELITTPTVIASCISNVRISIFTFYNRNKFNDYYTVTGIMHVLILLNKLLFI